MSENQKIQLVTENLNLGYSGKDGKLQLLQKDINEKLIEGELVCLIGANGSGKSTLIRTLGGIQMPVSGKVYIGTREIHQLTNAEKSKLLSIVLTDNTAVGNITISEIVALGRYNYTNWLGTLGGNDRERILESIHKVGLKDFENRRFGTLSDGEKQRVFIAKGLASDAPLMLLDEPTAHLDIPNKVSILSLLRQLTRESLCSVLVATHELDLALKLADEIWLLLPDQTIYKGTPEELIFSGILNKVFGNELLRFDARSGNFTMNTNPTGSVSIEGKGKNMDMSVQAFRRIGFTTDSKTRSNFLKVFIHDTHWIVDVNGEKTKTLTLADTCRFLRGTMKTL